ncbi:MAG: hypothetical protein HOQ28_19575 [Thermoleophilia bacterium]|nr:hypothetical protein [Thermoleophilia bacterium]
MIDDDSEFDWAEALQRDADDESFAEKARVIATCAAFAALIIAAGVLAAVL